MQDRLRTLFVWTLIAQLVYPASAADAADPTDGSTHFADRAVGSDGALSASASFDAYTGAAIQRIPLELPRGTGGMTPELTLTYSSHGPLDSWVGSRWSLGLSTMTRSLEDGVPTYDDDVDVFVLDGQKLVPENGSPALPRRYRTRRESFLRIIHEADDTWTILRKDGTATRFGLTANARIENGHGAAFQWLYSEQEDLHGNAIVASYDRSDPGTAYLSEIRYTLRRVGASLQSIDNDPLRDRVVSFVLTTRTDHIVNYGAGFAREMHHRLNHIDVSVGGELFRQYNVAMTGSLDSTRSLLTKFEIFGTDADEPSPTPQWTTTFEYHSNVAAGTTGWALDPTWSWSGLSIIPNTNNDDGGVRFGDVDGDGLPDLIKSVGVINPTQIDLTSDSGVYLNTGTGFSPAASSVWTIPTFNGPASVFTPVFALQLPDGRVWGSGRLPIDLTGDGRVDILAGLTTALPVDFAPYLAGELVVNAWPWFESSEGGWIEQPGLYNLQASGFSTALNGFNDLGNDVYVGGNSRFADLDGDGLPDLIVRGSNVWYDVSPSIDCHQTAPYGPGYANSLIAYNLGGLSFHLDLGKILLLPVDIPPPRRA